MQNIEFLEISYTKIKSKIFDFKNSTIRERKSLLLNLKLEIQNHEKEIIEALKKDFQKPATETIITEIHTSIDEINFALNNLSEWIKPVRVNTPIEPKAFKPTFY